MARSQAAATEVAHARMPMGTTGDGDTADMDIGKQQHQFSGKTCEIKLYKPANDPKKKEQFFGLNFWQATIQFDKWVRVPVEVAEHIESTVESVREPDPEQPDNEDAYIFVERPRFPSQRRD